MQTNCCKVEYIAIDVVRCPVCNHLLIDTVNKEELERARDAIVKILSRIEPKANNERDNF